MHSSVRMRIAQAVLGSMPAAPQCVQQAQNDFQQDGVCPIARTRAPFQPAPRCCYAGCFRPGLKPGMPGEGAIPWVVGA